MAYPLCYPFARREQPLRQQAHHLAQRSGHGSYIAPDPATTPGMPAASLIRGQAAVLNVLLNACSVPSRCRCCGHRTRRLDRRPSPSRDQTFPCAGRRLQSLSQKCLRCVAQSRHVGHCRARQSDIGTPQVVEEPHGTASTVEPRREPVAVGLEDFTFVSVLGRGNFGKVYTAENECALYTFTSLAWCVPRQVMLAESRHSGEMYAVKIIKKAYTLENDEVDTYVSRVQNIYRAVSVTMDGHPCAASLLSGRCSRRYPKHATRSWSICTRASRRQIAWCLSWTTRRAATC